MNDEPDTVHDLNSSPPVPPTLVLGDDWDLGARDYLDTARQRLFVWHTQGASGTAVVKAYTAVMDHLVRTLFDAASEEYAQRFSRLDQGCTIVAQGGYGRAELNPHSDIDLLFLYSHKREPYIENVAERILYTLWDTRLSVGNAMRNVRECVRLAGQDFKVKTSLLDARYLCGDEALYAEFARRMNSEVLKRNAERFFSEKLAENSERHRRYGDSVYLLEPQLKEGEGGLRDLHTAMWMAKVKFSTNSVAELVQKSVITERERQEIDAARDFLFRVRNSLHFLSGQRQDQLTFEYQERLTPLLGFEDTPHLKGVEHFMRTYYLNAATINRFADEIIERCTQRKRSYFPLGRSRVREIRPGVKISDGFLIISGVDLLRDDPSNLVRLFLDAQRHGVALSNTSKRLMRASLELMDDLQRRNPATVEAFFQILGGFVAHVAGVEGQILDADRPLLGEDDGPFDDVLQLAHVASPFVVEQGPHRPVGDARDVPTHLPGVLVNEMVDQQGNVLLALAQRRKGEAHDIESIQQIFAKLAGGHHFFEVAVAGGDDADLNRPRLRVADGHDHALFQHAQQGALHRQGQCRDFIEKQGAAAGRLEVADFVADGAGERPAAVAEKLRFDQALRDGSAVDRHEWLAARDAVVVNRPGEQFLARTRLADQQHAAPDLGELGGRLEQLLHADRLADQIVKGRALGKLLGHHALGAHRVALLQGPFDFEQHVVELHRLEQVVVGPRAHGRHRVLHRAVGRQDNHRRLGQGLADVPQQLQPVHLRHTHVGEHQVHVLLEHDAVSRLAVAGLKHAVALVGEQFGQRLAQHLLVLGDQNRLAHRLPFVRR